MITILSGTNRIDSFTKGVAQTYFDICGEEGIEALMLDLENFPEVPLGDYLYRKNPNLIRDYGHSIFNQSDKLLLVSPEYNGSFPGILKLLIDSCEPSIFKGKRIALVGVASGRAGNLRGMDHLTGVFHYLNAEVYSLKLPISQIRGLVDAQRLIQDVNTKEVLRNQLRGFVNF
jgi:NAD(P)H-dependent FMN reductase